MDCGGGVIIGREKEREQIREKIEIKRERDR